MKKDKTPVIFRKWPGGDVIALFPTELGTADPYTCSSYEHVGQHGAADPQDVISATKPASPGEYSDLLAELITRKYDDLQIYRRNLSSFLGKRATQLASI